MHPNRATHELTMDVIWSSTTCVQWLIHSQICCVQVLIHKKAVYKGLYTAQQKVVCKGNQDGHFGLGSLRLRGLWGRIRLGGLDSLRLALGWSNAISMHRRVRRQNWHKCCTPCEPPVKRFWVGTHRIELLQATQNKQLNLRIMWHVREHSENRRIYTTHAYIQGQ